MSAADGRGRVGVVVVAAGRGERLGCDGPKALVALDGEPLVVHAVRGLLAADLPAPVVVHPPGAGAEVARALGSLAVGGLVAGGATRTDSVRRGVDALPPEVDVVAVHDAARPLVPAEVLREVVAAVTGDVVAAAPGLPVADTLKRVEGDTVSTVDRAGLVAVQTPQVFPRAVLVRALADADEATDDLALVERLLARGELTGRIRIVPGSARAMKVTFPEDLLVAEALRRAVRA